MYLASGQCLIQASQLCVVVMEKVREGGVGVPHRILKVLFGGRARNLAPNINKKYRLKIRKIFRYVSHGV